jgi:hypothetical protein
MASCYNLVNGHIYVQTFLALRNFAHKDFNNGAHTVWLGLSSERELAYSKSLPNKNEHVRTKMKEKKHKNHSVSSPYGLLSCTTFS